MKDNERLVKSLNYLLADELAAINKFIVDSDICGNPSYPKLHNAIRKKTLDDMHNSEWIIEKIIFLIDHPVFQNKKN